MESTKFKANELIVIPQCIIEVIKNTKNHIKVDDIIEMLEMNNKSLKPFLKDAFEAGVNIAETDRINKSPSMISYLGTESKVEYLKKEFEL